MANMPSSSSLSCDIVERRYDFISLSLLKDLSAVATVTGMVRKSTNTVTSLGSGWEDALWLICSKFLQRSAVCWSRPETHGGMRKLEKKNHQICHYCTFSRGSWQPPQALRHPVLQRSLGNKKPNVSVTNCCPENLSLNCWMAVSTAAKKTFTLSAFSGSTNRSSQLNSWRIFSPLFFAYFQKLGLLPNWLLKHEHLLKLIPMTDAASSSQTLPLIADVVPQTCQ